jgi:DNA-binding LacI/PurR family transcriptional regulator
MLESTHVANIFEVAKRAGVSTATASRVLSNAAVVAPDTKKRVLAAGGAAWVCP